MAVDQSRFQNKSRGAGGSWMLGFLFAMLASFVLTACSQYRNNIFSKTYHNTTARYNAYFIAKEEMKAAQKSIWDAHKENYHKILTIYPDHASAAGAVNKNMEKAIKMASLPIQWHKNSKWIDDCYQLIGQARFYKEDYDNAIKTFKYINTTFEDEEDSRLQALNWLSRIYIMQGDYRYARITLNFLENAFQEEKLDRTNRRDYHLNQAYFAYKHKDWKKVESNVGEAIPFVIGFEKRARLYFIIAQIRQRRGDDLAAEKSYKSCLRNNPEYEMAFEARLSLAEVTRGDNPRDVKKLRKYFDKQLKDEKNIDLQDRIYYAMGNLEYRLGNRDTAMSLFQTAAHAEGTEPNTKGYAYLKLGKIYYEDFEDYEKAHLYYDSSVNKLQEDLEEYPRIKRRSETLTNLWDNYKVYLNGKEDRRIISMDSTELDAYIAQQIDKKIEEEEEEKRRQLAALEKQRSSGGGSYTSNPFFDNKGNTGFNAQQGSGDQWYFENQMMVANGSREFKQIWGERELTDYWRVASLARNEETDKQDTAAAPVDSAAQDSVEKLQAERDSLLEAQSEETEAERRERIRKDVVANLPTKEEVEGKGSEKMAMAMYQSGSIFRHKLEEREKAIQMYEEFIDFFPEHDRAPEIAYALYVMYDDPSEERRKIAQWLIEHYPDSEYAKMVQDPDFRFKYKIINERVQKMYKSAFKLYKQKRYTETILALEDILSKYPESDYTDNIVLLKAIVTGRTLDVESYIQQLESFIEEYPKSELLAYAQELLENAKKMQEKGKEGVVAESTGQPEEEKSPYTTKMTRKQRFVAIFPLATTPIHEVKKEMAEFNGKFFDTEKLTMKDLLLDSEHMLIVVYGLRSKILAESYYEKVTGPYGPFKQWKDQNIHTYLISDNNFTTFYKRRDIKGYGKFFKKNYKIRK